MTPHERATRAQALCEWWHALLRAESFGTSLLVVLSVCVAWRRDLFAMMLPWGLIVLGIALLRMACERRARRHMDELDRIEKERLLRDGRRRP